MSDKASAWFHTAEDFLTVAKDAVSLSRSENAQEFAAEMLRKAKDFGLEAYLSERQCAYLCTLGDAVMPLRIKDRA
jgi:hypothetical protein